MYLYLCINSSSGQRDDASNPNIYELNGTGVINENQYATTANLDEVSDKFLLKNIIICNVN